MSDPNNNPQGNSSQQGQDPANQGADKTTQQQGQPNTQNDQSDKDKNFDAVRKQLADKDKIIAKYEKEKADTENEKLKAEGKLQELLDKTTKEKADLETKYQTEKRQTILEKELAKSGINSEFLDLIVPSLLPEINFDDSNTPQNLTDVINNLKTAKPSLFAQQKPVPASKVGLGVTNSNNQTSSLSYDEAQQILEKGDAIQIAKNKEAIEQALTENGHAISKQ